MKTVRSVERAISILFLIAQNDRPMGLSEISRSVDLDKATTLRLLSTLEGSDLIQQDSSTRRYLLGPAVNLFSGTWREDLRLTARPWLKSLWRETQETVCLATPRGLERVYVEIFPAMYELSDVPAIGRAYPIHVGAAGAVIMANLPEAEQMAIVERVETEAGADNIIGKQQKKIWQDAIRQGYAYTVGYPNKGSAALAAPVFDRDGEVVGAVVVRGPEVRLTRAAASELAAQVRETAERISQALGYVGEKKAARG